MFFNKLADFVAIGDTAVDAFIRLKEASEHCNVDETNCKLCLSFRNKIPYEFTEIIPAVGNSANAAVSASRLGIKSAIVTDIGDDQYGKDCEEKFKKENVKTKFVRKHKKLSTNYHYVLWFDKDRTILVKHNEFPYADLNIGSPKMVYLSSLGGHSQKYHESILKYLNDRPRIKLVFQPGTFQINLGIKGLKEIYARTDIFISNVEELKKILNDNDDDLKALCKKMSIFGPKIVVVTDGPKGSYVFENEKFYFLNVYPQEPAYERTGAGDAFSSAFASAILLGKTIPEAMMWGSINGMSVCKFVGAQKGLLTQKEIEEYIKKAPEGWKVEEK